MSQNTEPLFSLALEITLEGKRGRINGADIYIKRTAEKMKIEEQCHLIFWGMQQIFMGMWMSELDLMTKRLCGEASLSTYQCGEDIVIILCHHPHGESLREKVT